MATFVIPPLNYDSRAYEEIRDDLISLIPFFTPEWTDHNPSDFGIVLVQLFAAMGDTIHYYIDRAAGEAFLPTAIKRESVINLLKLIDYAMGGATAAQVDLEFSLAVVHGLDIPIPVGTEVQTAGATPIIFTTIVAETLVAGNLTVTVSAAEGDAFDEFDLGESNANAFQRFESTFNPIIDSTIEVLVDETGVGGPLGTWELWTRVDSFIDSTGIDEHYKILRDAQENVTVEFGDNAQGKIPVLGSKIRIRGRIGGGIAGNVGANTITVVNSTIKDTALNPVSPSVTNPASATGGEDREAIEEAKIQGPRSLRALNRAVTLADYETLTQNIDGVLRAKASYNSVLHEVTVYALPVGGGLLPAALKTEIETYLLDRNCLGTDVVAASPTYIECVIAGEVTVLPNYTQTGVQAAVEEKLDEFFALTSSYVGFGLNVYKSDIYRAIDEVDGVSHVDLDELHIDAISTLVLNQWSGGTTYATTTGAKFALDTITTDVAAVEEEWTITFTSPTTFSVLGSVSGPHAAGTVGVAYTAIDGFGRDMVTFTLSGGVTAMSIGDNCQFTTSQKFENIPIGDHEIVTLKTPISLTYVGGA